MTQTLTSHTAAVSTIDKETDAARWLIQSLLSHRNAMVPISTLLPELLARIFRFLILGDIALFSMPAMGWFEATHVCQHWRQVALDDSSLWARVTGFLPLQISKILSHPTPHAGDLIKLNASATVKSDAASAGGPDTSLKVIAHFPGGLDFGHGLIDINFTMWPLFKALNIDNILTICEVCTNIILFDNVLILQKIALAPTGRILFYSHYPVMLGVRIAI